MKKNYKNKGLNGFGARKEFKNVPVGNKFNPVKKWHGTVSTDKGSYLVTYEGKYRSEAKAIFEEYARELNGKLDSFIGAF